MMRAAPALPSRILVCGRNDQLSRHAFHDAVGLTPRDPEPEQPVVMKREAA